MYRRVLTRYREMIVISRRIKVRHTVFRLTVKLFIHHSRNVSTAELRRFTLPIH